VTAQPTPVSWEHLSGTDWALVMTNDSKKYYYNTRTQLMTILGKGQEQREGMGSLSKGIKYQLMMTLTVMMRTSAQLRSRKY
jgi:hypothetical protein